jgi:GNAT superfamily N-acetyltransferase
MVSVVSGDLRIERAGVDRVDEAGPLLREMVEHHCGVVAGAWPVREGGEAWRRRRRQYVSWLGEEEAWLRLAFDGDDASALSYAVLRLEDAGPTWETGDRVAEPESLAVAERARSRGIGTRLLEAARDVCREAGVSHWLVAVVEANQPALRLYERAGFRPYYRQLLAEV